MDFEATGFPFTPQRIAQAIAFARGTSSRWTWRDQSPSSPHLHLVVGARTATYYRRGRTAGKVLVQKIGPAEGPAAVTLERARRICNELQFGPPRAEAKTSKRTRLGVTVGAAWDRYLAAVKAGTFSMRRRRAGPLAAKTLRGYESIYNVHLRPHADQDFAWLVANARDLVEKIGTSEGKGGKTHGALGNQVLQVTKNLVEFARRERVYEGPNPLAQDVERFHVRTREIQLTRAQAARILAAIKSEPAWEDLFLFLALTGRRLRNATHLKWDQVDFDAGWVYYPSSSQKNKRPARVKLTKGVRQILARRRKLVPKDSPFVWPSPKDPTKPVANPHHAWDRIRELAGFPELVVHELRHVAVSWALEGGAGVASTGSMASHRDLATTSRYAHLGGEAAAEALQAVERAWSEAEVLAKKLKLPKPPKKPRKDNRS
jgi:integrase